MRMRAIHPGDLVMVNRKGRIFYAKVVGLPLAGALDIEPLDRRVSYRLVKSGEVVDHWTHARPDRSEKPSDEQLGLDF